jgi:Cu(I)/Ag(I) efflux system membrane protein CusA/SilA
VITLWIDWCARNRFLVFTGTFVLLLAGLWTMRRIPLDALPDLSDVQVIIHTPWNGEPPNIIEDQVTYPIVTALLAAPHAIAIQEFRHLVGGQGGARPDHVWGLLRVRCV